MVELQPSKLIVRVRFPSPAPNINNLIMKITKINDGSKRTIINIGAVFNLTGKAFILNPGAPFFVLFFPLLLLLIFGTVFKVSGNGAPHNSEANTILCGIIIAAVTGNGLNGLSARLTQWKQSTIIRRIGATPLKRWEFLVGALSFYVATMIFQIFWIISLGFMLQGAIGHINTSNLNIWAIIVAGLLTILFAVSLGVLLSSLTNDINTNSLFGIMIFLPSAFLSGQYIPLNQIKHSKGLNIASELWPQRYLVIYMYHGFGADKSLSSNGTIETFWTHNAILLGALYPLLISIFAIFIASRLFKWE